MEAESALYPVIPPNKSMYEPEEEDGEGAAVPKEAEPEAEEKMISCGCFQMAESKYVLILFMSINMFLFADQNLLAPNLSVIAEEFGMLPNERDVYLGGYISLGFFAVGGIVSMIIGFLADVVNRKWTFAFAVVAGELSCMLTYWVPTNSIEDFWTGLWLTRAITGIAIGGAIPIQYSVFGDYFSEMNRGKAVAFLQIAVGIGAGIGQAIAGFLSPDWRTPFLIVSIPAFLLIGVYLVTTQDPQRGRKEKALQSVKVDPNVQYTLSWAKLRSLIRRPTFLLVLLQGLPGILPWGVGQTFLNDFLIREKNLTSVEAAIVIPIQGIGIGVATVVAGFACDYLWRTGKPLYIPVLAGVTTFFASFPMMAIVSAPPLGFVGYLLLLPPTGFIAGLGGTCMKTLLINVTLPETRGTAFAFQSLFDDLGRGIGPFFVSLLIVAAGSRTSGIFIGYSGWIPCSFVMLTIVFFLKKDIQRNEEELKMTRERRLSL